MAVDLYDTDAQGELLAAAMMDKRYAALVLSSTTLEDYSGADRAIYGLIESGTRLLPETTSRLVKERFDDVSTRLIRVPDASDVEALITRIRNQSALRKLRGGLFKALEMLKPTAQAGDVAGHVASVAALATTSMDRKAVYSAAEAAATANDLAEQWASGDPTAGLVQTRIPELDRALGGVVPEQVTTIGARPSKGKTVLGLQIARNGALHNRTVKRDAAWVVVSLEMAPHMLMIRLASSMTAVNWKDVRSKAASPPERQRWSAQLKDAGQLPLEIIRLTRPTAGQLYTQLNLIGVKYADGIDGIVVDFIELMDAPGTNETAQIGNVMRGLKGIAQMFCCPVVALSQLSRGVDNRPDKVPVMADLRQSGMIEALSQQVLMLYYPDGYRTVNDIVNDRWSPHEAALRQQKSALKKQGANYLIKIEKNRDEGGGVGVPLLFEPDYTRFASPSQVDYQKLLSRLKDSETRRRRA